MGSGNVQPANKKIKRISVAKLNGVKIFERRFPFLRLEDLATQAIHYDVKTHDNRASIKQDTFTIKPLQNGKTNKHAIGKGQKEWSNLALAGSGIIFAEIYLLK